MTNPKERLIVVKERYLLIADYDMAKAEILYRLAVHGTWKALSMQDWVYALALPIGANYVSKKLSCLETRGLIEIDRNSRPHKYRIIVDKLQAEVDVLNLDLLDSVGYDVDQLMDFEIQGLYKQVAKRVDYSGKQVAKSVVSSDKVTEQVAKSVAYVAKRVDYSEESDKQVAKSVAYSEKQVAKRVDYSDENNILSIYNTTDDKDSTSTGDRDSTSTDDNHGTTTVEDMSDHSSAPSNYYQKRKRRPVKHYTWKHYSQITAEKWSLAKTEGEFPDNESAGTLLIGAYLLGMYKKHQEVVMLASGDYNRLMTSTSEMLQFFNWEQDDPLRGFAEALDWIKEFLNKPADSYEGKAGWPINMCFTRNMYRQKGFRSNVAGKKINDTGVVLHTDAQRRQRMLDRNG